MQVSEGVFIGHHLHIISLSKSASIGPNNKAFVWGVWGENFSFVISLITSANGCSSPIKATLFGPFRICE